MLNKQRVKVEEYYSTEEESSSEEEDEEEGWAIKVTKIPPETTEEEILLFFENRKKSGGGEVEKVEYDKSTHTAIIWFAEHDGMTLWLKVQNIYKIISWLLVLIIIK